MEIQIQLYQCCPPDHCKKFKKITIKGKIAEYFKAPTRIGSDCYADDYEHGKNVFDYCFDNTYKAEFPRLKLTHRFTFFHNDDGKEDNNLGGEVGYAHLSFLQKVYLNWVFRKSWLQKSENIKWLVSIPLSIITALVTTWLANHFHIFE